MQTPDTQRAYILSESSTYFFFALLYVLFHPRLCRRCFISSCSSQSRYVFLDPRVKSAGSATSGHIKSSGSAAQLLRNHLMAYNKASPVICSYEPVPWFLNTLYGTWLSISREWVYFHYKSNAWNKNKRRLTQQKHDTENNALRHFSHVSTILHGIVARLLLNSPVLFAFHSRICRAQGGCPILR